MNVHDYGGVSPNAAKPPNTEWKCQAIVQFSHDAPKRNPGNVLGCVSDDQTDK